ncbi:uncharacterized protein LOC103697684 [Phoenix dactylifera]|uniref:Uncharacterized protein LOC103697684 n=1 Tax=Phoenix dactylifera TaxID=42345 RepID=A0A8B7BIR1_PHODC|nr:uncharacterized protein LOC103697684 [Phoenix dactylifera]
MILSIHHPSLQRQLLPPMLIHAALSPVHHPWLLLLVNQNNVTAQKVVPMAGFRHRRPSEVHRCRRAERGSCNARRRVRYEDDEMEGEDYGRNSEIEMLETYSQSARNQALLVRATVDGEEEVVLIFKGFSSCLSSRTASDPSKSVLPGKAVIQSIDVIKGPFDPCNIEYLEKNLTWEAFKARLQSN